MAIDVLLCRDGSRLAAVEPISAEAIEGFKFKEVLRCTIKRARNYRHHCKFMAMLQAIFDNQDKYATLKHLLDTVKIGIGHCDWLTLPGLIPMQIPHPRSINFDSLDQADFEQFYNRAVEYVLKEILPGLNKADLDAEVLSILAGNRN